MKHLKQNYRSFLLTSASVVVLSACSSTPEEAKSPFTVPSSFLKADAKSKSKSEEPQVQKKAQAEFRQTQISTLGSIRTGSSLLIQLPISPMMSHSRWR